MSKNTITQGEEILALDQLKMYFPIDKHRAVRAVDDVSLSIKKGEIVGLVGESGSGKSTIAYTFMGMYKQTGGRMVFKGEELVPGKRSMAFKRDVQIVFQDPGSSLNPYKDVRGTLMLPLKVHKIADKKQIDEKIYELLEMVELPRDFMFKKPSNIGGGEKQLVSIARALCSSPEFIVLDEPTSALDVSIQAKIINMLLRLYHERSLTYLLITHDLSLVRNISTRVAIMYLGKINEIAPTEAFYKNPIHPYTQMLLSSKPVISEEEERLKPKKVISTGEIPSPVNIPKGCGFNTRCRYRIDKCMAEDPVMTEIQPGHFVRCHRCWEILNESEQGDQEA